MRLSEAAEIRCFSLVEPKAVPSLRNHAFHYVLLFPLLFDLSATDLAFSPCFSFLFYTLILILITILINRIYFCSDSRPIMNMIMPVSISRVLILVNRHVPEPIVVTR